MLPISEWADVCLKNIIVCMAFLRDVLQRANSEEDVEAVKDVTKKIYESLQVHENQNLETIWVPLPRFNEALDALVQFLGHPARLIEVGRYSSKVSFGFEYVQRLLLKGFAKWFTSPKLGVNQIPEAAVSFNRNKKWEPLLPPARIKNRQLFAVTYVPGANGEPPRSPLEDYRSLLYFVRGVLEAIAPMWSWQGQVGKVFYRVINLPILELLRLELPAPALIDICNGYLEIEDRVYGRTVYLIAEEDDNNSSQFLGRYTEEPPSVGAVHKPAVLILQDVLTPCQKTGELLPLVRAGEIYAHPKAELPATIIELSWREPWLSRLAGSLSQWFSRAFSVGLRHEARVFRAQAQAADAQLKQELGRKYLASAFPTSDIAHSVTRGEFTPLNILTCVIFVDLVASTELNFRMQHAEKVELIRSLMDCLASIASQHNGWYYKFTGDGGVFVFTNGWSTPPLWPLWQSVAAALRAALQMRKTAAERKLQLRIGIHVGQVTWYPLQDKFAFEGTGLGLDDAKRMEEVCPNGQIAVSAEAVQALGEAAAEFELGTRFVLTDKHGFEHNAYLL